MNAQKKFGGVAGTGWEVPGPHDVLLFLLSRLRFHSADLLFRHCRLYRRNAALTRLRRWGDGPEPRPFPSGAPKQ